MFICQICLKQYSYKDKFDSHVERCVREKRSKEIPERRSRDSASSEESVPRRRSTQQIRQQYQMIDSLLEQRNYTVEDVSPRRDVSQEMSPPRVIVPTRITIHTQNQACARSPSQGSAPSEDVVKRMRQIHTEMKSKYQETVDEMKEVQKKNSELENESEKKNAEFVLLKEKAIKMATLFKNTLIKQKADYDSRIPLKTERIDEIMKRNEVLEKQRYDVELLKTQFSSLLESRKNRYENEIVELKKEIIVLKEQK